MQKEGPPKGSPPSPSHDILMVYLRSNTDNKESGQRRSKIYYHYTSDVYQMSRYILVITKCF